MDEEAPVVTDPPASSDPKTPAPSDPAPSAPVSTTPPAPTPLEAVPALDIKAPTPLTESQRDGTNFYFGGRTEGTNTTGTVDTDGTSTVSRTGERTTTVSGGVSYGSGDRNGDGLEDQQVRVDASVRNQTTQTNGQGTSTTTLQADGSYVYTPSANFKAWGEAGFSTTSDGTTRTSTNYAEGGIEGRIANNATQRERGDALDREMGEVYLNPEAARGQIERMDSGFAQGGQSFAQIADLLRDRGSMVGTLSPAGLLDPAQVEQAIAAYADHTQSAIDRVRDQNPESFQRAVAYTQAVRDGFTRDFGDQAETVWRDFQSAAERDGYAAAARALPPGVSETLVGAASALDTAKASFGAEVMNAAEDQVSITAYRASTPGTTETPTQPGPSQETPTQETPSRTAPSPEPEAVAPMP